MFNTLYLRICRYISILHYVLYTRSTSIDSRRPGSTRCSASSPSSAQRSRSGGSPSESSELCARSVNIS